MGDMCENYSSKKNKNDGLFGMEEIGFFNTNPHLKWTGFYLFRTCHFCGYVYEELTLSTRKWECPVCHTVHDRDKNAAQNIKAEGIRIVFA